MRLAIFRIASIFTFSFPGFVSAQNNAVLSTSKVIQQMTDSLAAHSAYHYKAQMRFKEMGGDTFETRNFNISYKSDMSNPLYGYNWEISEKVDSGYAYIWMILPENLYVIFEGNKGIGYQSLPKTIDLGSYLEFLRSSFILEEVVSPFVNVLPDAIMIRDSADNYYLTQQMSELATRQLVLSKKSYLPIRSTITIGESDFQLVQIEEYNFSYDNQIWTLPDTAFSPEHYLSLGYTIHGNDETETPEEEEVKTLSLGNIDFLLHYPLVTETGDTISIAYYKAGYILLDFWYASCEPCLRALPEINQLAKDYADAGLTVMGINCIDKGISASLAAKLRAKNITIPLLFGSRGLLQSLKMNVFPTYVLITPDRRVEILRGGVEEVKSVLETVFEK